MPAPTGQPLRAYSPAGFANAASRGAWRGADHLDLLNRKLMDLAARDIRRLLVSMPPRHGKSELISKYFPAWWLGSYPTDRVMLATYEADFAATWGRKARDIFADYGGMFGLCVHPDVAATAAWDAYWMPGALGPDHPGGPSGGGMVTAGVGGPVTGKGANLLILDDPVKNAEEANSEVQREKVWEWFTSTAYTRLEPDAVIVILMTRWHEDDLIGRLLAAAESGDLDEHWEYINIPAIADEGDPLGREPGEALWPVRYPINRLNSIRATLGEYYFEALYQGRPRPKDGGFFKSEWFDRNMVDAIPKGLANYCRYWDRAGTDGAGDWTVGVLMGRAWDGTYYILDVQRFRYSAAQRDDLILRTARNDREKYENVMIRAEQEPGSSGKDAAFAFVKMLDGFDVKSAPVTGDKQSRARPYASQAEIGNVKMVRAGWNRQFVDEHAGFPRGTHDDQVDAASGAYNALGGAITAEWGESPVAGWTGRRSVQLL